MSAAHNKQTESKYVSCFADSHPDVDITFRDVLLKRPTDHYLVGIDNFSLTNSSLSMIEPRTGINADLIRIVRNPGDPIVRVPENARPESGEALDALFTSANNYAWTGNNLHITNADYYLNIPSTEVILNMSQLLHRLGVLAGDVNSFMNTGLTAGASYEFGGYTPNTADVDTTRHLEFSLNSAGQITIHGSRAFWSCFSIEIPSVQNQFGFHGTSNRSLERVPFTRLRRFLSVHPETGVRSYNKILVNRFPKVVEGNDAAQAAARAYNSRLIGGSAPHGIVMATTLAGDPANFNTYHANKVHALLHSIQLDACVFSSLERRIALEVGCSLPIKNSPMVDHAREAPDFVLGRWIWKSDPRVRVNDSGGQRAYEGSMPSCIEYQGARDRITYHELMAQSKIQTLRVKLFARLRTFDEITEKWGMRVIELPSKPSDWWHARLHFISRD